MSTPAGVARPWLKHDDYWDAGELRCEATVLHVGSRTATAEARSVDATAKRYAHATTTCIVVERQVNV